MCHDVLQDPTFFRFLCRIDHELAAETRAGRCPGCAGPLHVADYPRKPRGCPAAVREAYSRRLSFTCGRCDARAARVESAVLEQLREDAKSEAFILRVVAAAHAQAAAIEADPRVYDAEIKKVDRQITRLLEAGGDEPARSLNAHIKTLETKRAELQQEQATVRARSPKTELF